jgi:hypothetical protein
MKVRHYILILISGLVVLNCTKTIEDNRENPFVNGGTTTPADSIDPTTIKGLHRNIFAGRCANPNCHDGTFEPDFRTIESTYQTLVYQEVIKNDTASSFTFRVHPGNADESWLVERLITDDDILGRMPLYAVPLSYQEVENVKAWINNGARDANGNTAYYPNLQPDVRYFVAYNTAGVRIDTARTSGWASAFKAPDDEDFNLLVSIKDDSTAIPQLQVNKFHLSLDKDDFSNAVTVNAIYYTSSLWSASIPKTLFSSGQEVFFRYEVKDPDHQSTIFYPNENSPSYIVRNASFIIQ